MATKTKPLTAPQKKMLDKLADHSEANPYMTTTGAEASTINALRSRKLIEHKFALKQVTYSNGNRMRDFTSVYWLSAAGKEAQCQKS